MLWGGRPGRTAVLPVCSHIPVLKYDMAIYPWPVNKEGIMKKTSVIILAAVVCPAGKNCDLMPISNFL